MSGHIQWNISLVAGAVLDLPNGAATTAELQQAVDGSTGQLYHHLRTLTGCGVAEQDGRGRYRVPPKAVGQSWCCCWLPPTLRPTCGEVDRTGWFLPVVEVPELIGWRPSGFGMTS